jgi:iron complex transport system substrate-binding protein
MSPYSPCGFALHGAVARSSSLLSRTKAIERLGRVYVVDANAHFSRPGPRVIDGVELMAALLHADHRDIPADRARRLA